MELEVSLKWNKRMNKKNIKQTIKKKKQYFPSFNQELEDKVKTPSEKHCATNQLEDYGT